MQWAGRGRAVVVTGLGAVTPLGVGARVFWERMCADASGIKVRALERAGVRRHPPRRVAGAREGQEGFRCAQRLEGAGWASVGGQALAARVPRGAGADELDASRVVPKAHVRAMGPDYIAMGLAAAGEALSESGLGEGWVPAEDARRERWGVAFGSGIGGLSETEEASQLVAAGQGRKVSPYYVPRMLVNMAAGSIAQQWGLRGPVSAPATACATGASAVGDGLRAIQSGAADVMLVGGTESCVTPLAITGFARLRALAAVDDHADIAEDVRNASRPFDEKRSGFVLGEGAAALVLEEREHARARGARVLAELVGVGSSADAFHPTQPPADGAGAARAMRAALRDAHLAPNDIDWVSAHATSTPLGDAAELRAIHAVFAHSHRLAPLPVSSAKGAVGHLLGAAGALEAVIAVQSILHNAVPHTRGLRSADKDSPPSLLLVRDRPLSAPVRHVLSNSFGFGGVNVSLIFRAPGAGVPLP
jgi:3-oxoacyl-[acyl-carrier-protein] synthase II